MNHKFGVENETLSIELGVEKLIFPASSLTHELHESLVQAFLQYCIV
jgi:hypothetical protein